MEGIVSRPQINLRLDPRSAAYLEGLQDKLNISAGSVMRMALARLAAQEGITVTWVPAEQDSA
jgi:hypothetical protein